MLENEGIENVAKQIMRDVSEMAQQGHRIESVVFLALLSQILVESKFGALARPRARAFSAAYAEGQSPSALMAFGWQQFTAVHYSGTRQIAECATANFSLAA